MKEKSWEEAWYEVVPQYTVRDIKQLMLHKVGGAGLLLMPAFVGMISLGHLLYGHEITDRAAFLKFVRHRMPEVNKPLAEILYDNLYDGLTKHWTPQRHVVILAAYSELDADSLWRHVEGRVHINAVKLASVYMTAVENLPKYSEKRIHKFSEEYKAYDPWDAQVVSLLQTRYGKHFYSTVDKRVIAQFIQRQELP